MARIKSAPNLVWMDLEMSGLEPERDVILEIATIVTDPNLNILAEGPVLAIHQTENVFEGMDDWNKRHHTQSGLVERCRKSTLTMADADKMTLDFIKPFTTERGNVLCGNSITQDRRFLYKYMPRIREDGKAPGPRRHPRKHRRTRILPQDDFQDKFISLFQDGFQQVPPSQLQTD